MSVESTMFACIDFEIVEIEDLPRSAQNIYVQETPNARPMFTRACRIAVVLPPPNRDCFPFSLSLRILLGLVGRCLEHNRVARLPIALLHTPRLLRPAFGRFGINIHFCAQTTWLSIDSGEGNERGERSRNYLTFAGLSSLLVPVELFG